MGLCFTKQNDIIPPSKKDIKEKPKIDIKFIDVDKFIFIKIKRKPSNKKIIFHLKAINKIRLRNKNNKYKKPPFK
jgi:hypothetical protein